MRAIGSATISFGMVSVPIKVYPSTDSSSTISFRQLHDKCEHPVKQQYICPECPDEPVVERDEMLKGYEVAKGKFVSFTKEEIDAISKVESDSTIEIQEFVPVDKVPRELLDKLYFIAPEKGGGKAFALLAAALKETKRGAIAKYASRGKEYLVMIQAHEHGLAMQQLYYGQQVRCYTDVGVDEVTIGKPEMDLAIQMVRAMESKTFDPSEYEDRIHWKVLSLIEQKLEGKDISALVTEDDETPKDSAADLMAALQASLDAAGGRKGKPAKKTTKAKKSA